MQGETTTKFGDATGMGWVLLRTVPLVYCIYALTPAVDCGLRLAHGDMAVLCYGDLSLQKTVRNCAEVLIVLLSRTDHFIVLLQAQVSSELLIYT